MIDRNYYQAITPVKTFYYYDINHDLDIYIINIH